MKFPTQSLLAITLIFFLFAYASPVSAEDHYNEDPGWDDIAEASPKEGWADLPSPEHHSTARKILLWLPNRVIDFLDIFRVDVGVGPSIGAVARITRYGQIGYRQMMPASLRVGLMGRRAPIMLEHGNEFGVGPLFAQNGDRKVCSAEIGGGLDVLVVGGYVGICLDEAVDFLGGIFTLDSHDDDFH